MRRLYKLSSIVALVLGIMAIFPFAWRQWVDVRGREAIYHVENAPSGRIAIVFGARVYASGRLSAMLLDRVETAIQLYEAGKVEKILMSGDNSSDYYNEPGAMIAYAVARGVPADVLQPDYAGLRTYDTCYRARAIFGLESAILVTQRFHLPRALFTCQELGIDVVGVTADRRTYSERSIAWSEMREIPATLVALVDVLRRKPPAFLGEPIPL